MKRILISFLLLGLLIIVGVLGYYYFNTPQNKITLQSQVPTYTLSWKNSNKVSELVKTHQIMRNNVTDPSGSNPQKVNSIQINFVNIEQPLIKNKQDDDIIASSNYSITNNKLNIFIHVNTNIALKLEDIQSWFNYKLVETIYVVAQNTEGQNKEVTIPQTEEIRNNYLTGENLPAIEVKQ
jgi:hypothetical protein